MSRNYPVAEPSSFLASGNNLYRHLMLGVPQIDDEDSPGLDEQIARLAVAKSLSSALAGGGKANYNEAAVAGYVDRAFASPGGPEMGHIVSGLHAARVARRYMQNGGSIDIEEFDPHRTFTHLPAYVEALRDVTPFMLHTISRLGIDTRKYEKKMRDDGWFDSSGSDEYDDTVLARSYPTDSPSSALGTGRALTSFVLENSGPLARVNHVVWYSGREDELARPDRSPFRGDIPVGKTVELVSLAGVPFEEPYADNVKPTVRTELESGLTVVEYTFTGVEDHVFVKDLASTTREAEDIPVSAKATGKVWNANFRPYDKLSKFARFSNELASLSVPLAVVSYLNGMNPNRFFSEHEIVQFVDASFTNMSGPELTHILHVNHLLWAVMAYERSGYRPDGDVMQEFYAQTLIDFFKNDLGTALPSLLFVGGSLGMDPMDLYGRMKRQVGIWDADKAAAQVVEILDGLR